VKLALYAFSNDCQRKSPSIKNYGCYPAFEALNLSAMAEHDLGISHVGGGGGTKKKEKHNVMYAIGR
jgi:hypothetical protein